MVDLYSIKTGDIIEFIKPKISKYAKNWFKNSDSGQHISTTAFKIQGVRGSVPFANGLVKKRFVAWVNTSNPNLGGELFPRFTFSLYLLDNYKPGILGSGYQISLSYSTRCFDQLKITGRILDLKKLPSKIQIDFYRNQVRTDFTQEKFNKVNHSTEDKIAFLRKNFLMLPGLPSHLQWAFLNVISNACQRCGAQLLRDDTKLVDMETVTEKESIAKSISAYLISNKNLNHGNSVQASPIAYTCGGCKYTNFLIRILGNESRKPYSFSNYPSYEPVNTLISPPLSRVQRDCLKAEVISW